MCGARIGLVSFDSLGDSLIYLMIAENLRLNGFDVSLYGNVSYQLRSWVPQLRILPLPLRNELITELEQYDLAIVSPPQYLRNDLSQEKLEEYKRRWVLICQRAPDCWKYDHSGRLQKSLSADVYQKLGALPRCGGAIRYRRFEKESVVDIALHYMREKMKLERIERHVRLTVPSHLEHRRYRQRIVVSPDSAWPEKKDWSPHRFFRLCRLLKREGYDPVIVVSPANHAYWTDFVHGELDTPFFSNIDELAAYIYESGALIANDSGNGHLASFLGVPVVTIYRKRNPYFHWRPDWGKGTVVTPKITIPWRGRTIWRPFINPMSVLRHLKAIHAGT